MEHEVVRICQEALVAMLWVSAPVAVAAVATGLAVALLQTATQVQEQTVSYVPKLVAVSLVLAVAGGWMLSTLVRFATACFERVPFAGR